MGETQSEQVQRLAGELGKIKKAAEVMHDRWLDEGEYEDWSGYVSRMEEIVKGEGFEMVKMTKRPFAVSVTKEEVILKVTVTNTQIKVSKVLPYR